MAVMASEGVCSVSPVLCTWWQDSGMFLDAIQRELADSQSRVNSPSPAARRVPGALLPFCRPRQLRCSCWLLSGPGWLLECSAPESIGIEGKRGRWVVSRGT